ncbi:MAG: Stk1 family PASTA domain-containing Ser/Thr kinase [Eubacterium sp.]|nr:Stk1 family PASTA domain-containing Ser/Thr kinase [Eubacterium sp.]MBR3174103.1 Stk1 family PASTA domain-containing Ser/Thr kinase [Eubacterium sp.]
MLSKGSFINDRYEIVSRVGAGGMSDVYKAIDHKLNRNVAIKVLKKEFSKDKNFVSKFRAEAQSAASLIHPNIVNVYDVGEDNGMYYIVMELIEGITLKSYIQKKGSLSFKETVSIAIQIANGMECAHNNQIVHRDIKPQNIMISREGKVKVTDFGIARAASANTMSGNAMGSVHYISPEQAGGQYVDEKSDIYSLGITMFEMLTGKVPFDGESTVSIALMHIQNSVPSVKEYLDNVPISLEKIILKCTQRNVNNRYPKTALLIADLKRSLVEPDVDFVVMDEVDDTTSTIMITDDEREKIPGVVPAAPKKDDDEDDIDVVNPKMDKLLTIGGICVGILALIIIAIIVTSLITGGSISLPESDDQEQVTTDPNKVEMPNVVGLTKEEAEDTLHDAGLGFIYNSDSEFSDEYPQNYILRQSADPGKMIQKNSTINLTLSKGPEKINVPGDIIGKDLADVTRKLDEVGLNWKIKYEFSSKKIGQVIDCSPTEKAPVSKHDTVELIVSRGQNSSGEKLSTVPNVVGKSQAAAQSAIRAANFGVGTITEVEDNKIAKGKVIRQIIKPGTKAPVGTSIGLIVSKGPKAGKYSAVYNFAKEDLVDESGKQIRSGNVTILLNGAAQSVNAKYSNVAKWPGDYVYKFSGKKKGPAQIELLVNGKIVIEDTVNLK